MKIAFYAPLKSPRHPVPSGDRLMARLLIRAMEIAGHDVEVASDFRSFAPTPQQAIESGAKAGEELERLRLEWASGRKPDLWFCYHPYYKSPDLLGPALCAEFGVPHVTAEASHSPKRDQGEWAPFQKQVVAQVTSARINIAFTKRDRIGLERAVPGGRFSSIAPFIDTTLFETSGGNPRPSALIAVAMMRSGDKFQSYAMLADALRLIADRPWSLTVVGDGPSRPEIEQLFSGLGADRVQFRGELSAEAIAAELGNSGIYVWPGCGEAYGLAYLEAQASGLPIVAQNAAGVPEVVNPGVTGYLTPEGDVAAYAAAIAGLLSDPLQRSAMGLRARRFVLNERSLPHAAQELDRILQESAG
ncbi:glycosyl transferase [Rhizobium sp. Root708]|uniref:glycosyltransferase family 4 protein n=1 Tax=Rhizobium sp. Root708 TaxID=1736592 RepID=UPI0006F98754|nr:glycosyltransferase [Rhizobium sp. Root708]KRB51380.1 glycosyl transferase [Rhizobium sp. Root708]